MPALEESPVHRICKKGSLSVIPRRGEFQIRRAVAPSQFPKLQNPPSFADSVVKETETRDWRVMISSPIPLKIHRVGGRCTLNLSRAQTSSHWCGVVVRRVGASSGGVLVT
ncbi:hypothetical protein TNCV_5013631 [Trichonephila clavipes]|nr:hypothetical protein TNCV_5013631 [Trichonephila clavipes]